MLNGSTVYGRHPVSIAYILTPLQEKKDEFEDKKMHKEIYALLIYRSYSNSFVL